MASLSMISIIGFDLRGALMQNVMQRILTVLLVVGCICTTTLSSRAFAELPGKGDDIGKTVLYRDTWGIPHIYAPTVAAGFYAKGYAQAQDRPQQLLMNLKIGMGELAEIAGPDQVPQDLLTRMFDLHGMAVEFLKTAPALTVTRLQAFADGINAFYSAHPEDLPDWWDHGLITPDMIDAFGRLFLYNWTIDEALGDLRRGGIEPDFTSSTRGSNQWAVAPSRSASGHAILLIDPHLAWWGPSRFWELRIHAGDLHGSGVSLAGIPYIALGHNANVAWAMTTGGPDTADVYELQLDPENPNRYRYDGKWREMDVRTVTIKVLGEKAQVHSLRFSLHGPIIAQKDGKAYAARIPYDASVDRDAAWRDLNFAEDYRGVIKANATLAMFPQNIMAADTDGNIYYQRTGRVPRRSADYDWSRPVDGSTSATQWQGIHPAGDHVQILNPEQGYMQNCNIPPDAMMVSSPLQLEDYPPYLYSSAAYGDELDGWTNQRGARAIELLSNNDSVTVEDALNYAVNVQPYGTGRWLAALSAAKPNDALAAEVVGWNRQLTRDSKPALRYAYWRMALDEHPDGAAIREAIDDHYSTATGNDAREVQLSAGQLQVLAATFDAAITKLQTEPGGLDATYGDVFRVGRDEASWPVGGGGGDQFGLTTLRNIGYGKPDEAFQRAGYRGQTSTQVVHLSKPIESWIYLPVGQSDRPDSPHYTDQAEKAFSPRRLKPSWWLPEDLQGHIESRTVLDYPPAKATAD